MTIEENHNSESSGRKQFVEAFLTEKPKDGIDIVQQRLRKTQKLNDELAEYFKERAIIEDHYAKSLVKLSKKLFITEKSTLGTMMPLWNKLSDEITEIATIHAVLAQRIAEEVEKPLRGSLSNDNNLSSVKNMDLSMSKYAKEYDELQLKLQKHQKIAEKAGSGKKLEDANAKLRGYQQVVDDLKQRWAHDGTGYLEQCQAIDEKRFNVTKELIQQFERAQADQLAKRIEYADNVIVTAISLETENEINEFTAHYTPHLKKLTIVAEPPAVPEPVEAPISLPAFLSEEPPVRSSDDAASIQTSGRNSVKEGAGKLKNALKSLRRRTQAGISRSNVDGTTADHAAEWATLDFDPNNANDVHSDHDHSYNNSNLSHSVISQNEDQSEKHQNLTVDNSAAANSMPLSGASSMTESWSTLGMQTHTPRVDEEGYSIPPPDRTPWQDAGTTTLQESEVDDNTDNSSIMSTSRIRVDIMNEAVKEDAEASHALNRVATILKEKNSPNAGKRPRGRRETLRINQVNNISNGSLLQFGGSTSSLDIGHLNKASTSPISAEFADTHLKAATAGSSSGFISPRLNPFDHQAHSDDKGSLNPFELDSRDTSIAIAAPDVQQMDNSSSETPHVSVDIAETVHVLTKAGEVVRSVVTGEVSLTYRGPAQAPAKPVCFKLVNTEDIERLVPNPAYLSNVDDHPGVFKLDVGMFSQAGGNPVVSLKYQIKMVGPSSTAVAPLIVQPIWKLEDNKSLLLVKYNGSAQGLSIDESMTLENVTFMVPVDGGVTSAQSMPACIWSMERQKLLWNLNNLSITANDEHEEKKLMAKFDTQTKGTPQAIAVKFTSPGRSISKVDIVQDETGGDDLHWVQIDSVQRRTSSGKYLADP